MKYIVLILISILFFIALYLLLAYYLLSKKLQINSSSIDSYFNELNALENRYITIADFKNLEYSYKHLYISIKANKLILKLNKFKKVKLFFNSYANLKEIIDEKNKQFINNELIATNDMLSNIDGKSLDLQQRNAVLVDEEVDLVLAGAGSGKTLTIAGKIKYLCERKKINQDDILLIAFTNKAADELSDRVKKLGIDINTTTFHKLGLNIIKENSEDSFDIYNNLDEFIEEYLKNNLQNKKVIQGLLEYFAYYLTIPEDYEKYKNIGELYEKEKHLDFETIKSKTSKASFVEKVETEKEKNVSTITGEKVKSLEEVSIANFLFLNGIEYQYEPLYPVSHGDVDKKSYRPDFYLPEYDIYIEHFGINKQGNAPWLSKIKEKKYKDGIAWKREFHAKNNTKLIETYSYYASEGILLDILKEKLIECKVEFREVDYLKIFNAAYESFGNKYFKEFIKLCSTFINLFKSKNLSIKNINEILDVHNKNGFMASRNKMFCKIITPIILEYELFLKNNKMIDFSDMITKAAKLLEFDKRRKYKYIIIDEFQDVSYGKMQLINTLKQNGNSKLFCVGDDWQSIYRFAGSDVSLITNCNKYYGNTKILRIENTYRNSQELIDVASCFIQKNPYQIKKDLKSNKHLIDPINIILNNSKVMSIENVIDVIVRDFGEKGKILILGRTQNDIDVLQGSNLFKKDKFGSIKIEKETNRIFNLKYPELDVSFLTVHKSKGLEADNVILINFENDLLGFPNKITDDVIINSLLSDKEDYAYAEERRLFYVALTRTKNRVYIIAKQSSPSEFYFEIKKYSNIKNFNQKDYTGISCPECGSGELIIRQDTKGKKFLACSHYPRCKYTLNNLEIIKKPIRCPSCGAFLVKRKGKFGYFFGCTNYPDCSYSKEIEV